MKYSFDEAYNRRVELEWEHFISGKPVNPENIRREIYDSWVRSREYQVDYNNIMTQLLSEEEIRERTERHGRMCEIALPFMEKIFELIRGSGSLVLLTDEEGYALKTFADEDIEGSASSNRFVEGSNRDERTAGTNGIGLCLRLDKPVQVWGAEHYAVQNKTWNCAAAPIHSADHEQIGALNVSGEADKVHYHTLGMVNACVKAIENEIYLKEAYNQIMEMNERLMTTLEAFPDGVILVDTEGRISQINSRAKQLLFREEKAITRRHFNELVLYDRGEFDLERLSSSFSEREVEFRTVSGVGRYYVSTRLACKSDGEPIGVVITLREMELVRKLINKVTAAKANYTFDDIIGVSPQFRESVNMARIAANSSANVLITGESGTGKELFAQSIHAAGPRRDAPLVAINCGALPKELIESELFGYETGAFTGARKEGRPGKFEFANGGTIFLDEIGDMPIDVQATLLRVIQNKEVTRVGGNKVTPINVRIIAATNKKLEDAIRDKIFRGDLYYRLNVLRINIPPLRERREDVRVLADHFLRRFANQLNKSVCIDESGYAVLENYYWPGNGRELENVIERAVTLTETTVLGVEELLRYISKNTAKEAAPLSELGDAPRTRRAGRTGTLKEMEREGILQLLSSNRGNLKRTAEELGIGRRTLYRKLEAYQIDYRSFRPGKD